MSKYFKYMFAVSIVSSLAGSYGGFRAGSFFQHHSEEKATRSIAIAHACGQYNAKSGNFEWVSNVPQIDVALLTPLPVRKPVRR